MSLFYSLAYRMGFTPWERAATHPPAAAQIAALLDREERERQPPPYGRALDLGCGAGGWAVQLATRGWAVTGIDLVPRALRTARTRAREAGVDVTFVRGDITMLQRAGVGSGFRLVWDFGVTHGLTPPQRMAVGREVSAVATDDATMLMLAWTPGRRAPLPRGMSRRDVETAFPGWAVVDEQRFDVSGLPGPLRHVDPCFYRLRRR